MDRVRTVGTNLLWKAFFVTEGFAVERLLRVSCDMVVEGSVDGFNFKQTASVARLLIFVMNI